MSVNNCPVCGTQIGNGVDFCTVCGHKLTEEEKNNSGMPPRPPVNGNISQQIPQTPPDRYQAPPAAGQVYQQPGQRPPVQNMNPVPPRPVQTPIAQNVVGVPPQQGQIPTPAFEGAQSMPGKKKEKKGVVVLLVIIIVISALTLIVSGAMYGFGALKSKKEEETTGTAEETTVETAVEEERKVKEPSSVFTDKIYGKVGRSAYIYYEPDDSDDNVMDHINAGSEVTVLAQEKGFYYVYVTDAKVKGWVDKSCVTAQADETTTEEPVNNKAVAPDEYYSNESDAYVSANEGLNMRCGPGTGYAVVTTLVHSDSLVVLGYKYGEPDWVYVKSARTGKYGWVDSKYITYSGNSGSNNSGSSDYPDIVYDTPVESHVTSDAGLNVRSGPGTDYSIVAKLNYYDYVQIIGRSSNSSEWVYIKSKRTGAYGWVVSQYLY